MRLHLIGAMGVDAERRRIAALRQMTAEQLLHLGQVVYLKGDLSDGEELVILYGADGSPIAIPDYAESAMKMVAARRLDLPSIH